MASRELRDEMAPETNGTPTAFPAGPQLDQDSILIVPPANLQRVAIEIVRSDFDAAKTARDTRDYGQSAKGEQLTYDIWHKELVDLYFGRREAKTVPWRFCSNRSLMIAMAILEVLHARIFPAVYNEELTRWRPTEFTDEERANRVEKFMFWWVRVHVKMREFFDRWVRTVIGFGRVMAVTSWDVHLMDKGQSTQPQTVINPDGTVSVSPAERIFDQVEKTRTDIIPDEDVYLQAGATDVQRDVVILTRHYLYRDLEEMERDGKITNVTQSSDPMVIALRDRLMVPGPAGTGDLTPEQLEELKDVKRRNVPVEVKEWWGTIDLDGDGTPEPIRLLVDLEHSIYLGAVALRDISTRGLRPIDLTMFMPRLDEPQGLFGLGLLEQVKELSLEIDAIFNQMTDANTLSVMRPGFYDPAGDIDAPAITLAPNKFTAVSNPAQSIFIPEIRVQTDQLILAIRLVMEFIERLTAASAYIMGKESEIVGGSGTATRTNEIVNAAGQRHAIPVQRLRDGAARIMTQILDQVQKNIPEGLESRVLGEKGEPIFRNGELSQEGIAGEFDAYLLPDESMGSKDSERQLAQLIWSMALQNPLIMSDPTKIYASSADVYKAYGKDPEKYLGVRPPMNQANNPKDENTMMLQGDFAQVRASLLDNPIEHIMEHQALLQDPVFLQLPQALQMQVGQFLQAHIQEHGQMMQLMLQVAQRSGKSKGGGNGVGSQGTQGGTTAAAQPVGPEPGMGSVQSPLAAARQQSGSGESQSPARGQAG